MATPGSVSPLTQAAACGAASTNATGGNQRHARQSATAVVPTRTTPTNASVCRSAGASSSGGEARTAIRPNEATTGESARIATVAATTALRKAMASPSSIGMRPYNRVAATRLIEMIARPTAVRTCPSRRLSRSMRTAPPARAVDPAINPMSTRISGPIHPRLKARLRKKTAPRTRASPPTQANARPVRRASRSAKLGTSMPPDCDGGCAAGQVDVAGIGADGQGEVAAVAGAATTLAWGRADFGRTQPLTVGGATGGGGAAVVATLPAIEGSLEDGRISFSRRARRSSSSAIRASSACS